MLQRGSLNPTNGVPTPWTDEVTARLKSMWDDGLTCAVIGAELGVTRNMVIGKARRLGLPGRKPVGEPRGKKRGDIDRGMTQRLRSRSGQLPPLRINETAPSVEFLGVPLLELGYRQCRFPRGEGADIRFCGQITAFDQSFCPHCHAIAYQQRTAA